MRCYSSNCLLVGCDSGECSGCGVSAGAPGARRGNGREWHGGLTAVVVVVVVVCKQPKEEVEDGRRGVTGAEQTVG